MKRLTCLNRTSRRKLQRARYPVDAEVTRTPLADSVPGIDACRTGGSISNRIQLSLEVAPAVADEIGAGRTGIRISLGNPLNDIIEHDVTKLYPALVSALAPLNLAYLHIAGQDDPLLTELRSRWPGTLLLNRAGTDLPT